MIVAADIELYLNPEGVASKYTTAAQAAGMVDDVIAYSIGRTRAYLPEKYRRMMRTVAGLVLTREAADGDTTFTLPTVCTTASAVTVWVNPTGFYGDRKKEDKVAATLTGATVTLTDALDEGDVVVCDVVHGFNNPPALLKSLCLDLAVAEIYSRKSSLAIDPETRQANRDRQLDALDMLKRISKGELRIDEWDELDLVGEFETVTPGGQGYLHPDGW